MASDAKRLQKLPGRGRKTFGLLSTTSTRLYLEDDHLLYVANDRFTEAYKRFYFRDIQALLLCKTNSGRTINFVLGGVAAFFAALGLLGDAVWNWGGIGFGVFGSIAGFFLVLLVINVVKGPTCLCQLKTAVHTEELPSLNRIKVAQKTWSRLHQEIAAAQGELTAEQIQAGALAQASLPAAAVPLRTFAAKPPPVMKHEHGRAHEIVAYLLLVDSVVTGLDIFRDSIALTVAGSLLGLGVLAGTVMALVRQNDSDLGRGLRAVMWSNLGYQGVMFLFGFVFTIFLTIKYRVQADNQWELIRLWSGESALDSPVLFWALTISAVTSLVLGAMGLYLVFDHRQRTETVSAETPASTS